MSGFRSKFAQLLSNRSHSADEQGVSNDFSCIAAADPIEDRLLGWEDGIASAAAVSPAAREQPPADSHHQQEADRSVARDRILRHENQVPELPPSKKRRSLAPPAGNLGAADRRMSVEAEAPDAQLGSELFSLQKLRSAVTHLTSDQLREAGSLFSVAGKWGSSRKVPLLLCRISAIRIFQDSHCLLLQLEAFSPISLDRFFATVASNAGAAGVTVGCPQVLSRVLQATGSMDIVEAYGQDVLRPGAVLLAQKVSLFSGSRWTHYPILCRDNIVYLG